MTDLSFGMRVLLTLALVATGAVWLAVGCYLVVHWARDRHWWPMPIALVVVTLLVVAVVAAVARLW